MSVVKQDFSELSGGGTQVYEVGTLTSSTPMTFNVSSTIPNYQNLTADNFVLSCTGIYYGDGLSSGTTYSYTKSYNASTGVLTLSRGSGYYLVGKVIAIV